MYPFYLFLICINGNSVCFNLCHATGWRAEKVSFFIPLTTEGQHPFFAPPPPANGRLALGGQEIPFFRNAPITFVGAHRSTSHLHQVQGGAPNVFSPEHSTLSPSVQTNYKMSLGWKCLEGGAAPTCSGPCGWKPLSQAGSSWCSSSLALPRHQSTAEGHFQLVSAGPPSEST